MTDIHQVVINHSRQMIKRPTISFNQNRIIQCLVFYCDFSAQQIVNFRCTFFWSLEAYNVRVTGCNPLPSFFRCDQTASAIVMRCFFSFHLLLSYMLQTLMRTKTVKRMSAFYQPAGIVLVDFFPFGLAVRTIGSPHIWTLIPL